MNRLLMRKSSSRTGKSSSCRSCCCDEGLSSSTSSPPCYDCTFNLQHPPPHYTSLAQHVYENSTTPTPLTPMSSPPDSSRGFYLDPDDADASPYTMRSLLASEEDYEVASLAQGIGRIAVAFLADGRRTENVMLLPGGEEVQNGRDDSHINSRRRHSSRRRTTRTRHRSSPAGHPSSSNNTSQGAFEARLSASISSAPQLRLLASSQVSLP